ncbi:ROK family protein [Paenibacillus daejeonensis]|uniref:ROK family protein n=1 Tax=Paenibacillus daejeonensis TaxID=135193 RepID=UPI00037F96E9|nr:ROK family protein [Paenibacillus daejeonensis]
MHPGERLPSAKRLIYNYVAQHGPLPKNELRHVVAASGSTLTRVLEEMAAQGLLNADSFGPSSGGRRPTLYQINPRYRYIFGLEISRLYSALALFDMQMNPISSIQWRMDEAMDPERLVEYVHVNAQAFLRDHQIRREQVMGMGIGAVGPLDREKGMILEPLYFTAKGWKHVPICRMLEERTGFPARLDNGANAALAGEHWSLREANLQHMLYVHAGVGLRSAMMSGGKIIRGSVDMEGAIGQMIIQQDGPRLDNHGNSGALEAFVSVQALEQQVRGLIKTGRDHLLQQFRISVEQVNYDILLQALAGGDVMVQELFTRSAAHLGIGLANLINILHPERIVLGGALVSANQAYYDTAIEVALKHTYYYPDYAPQFSKGLLREHAVAAGAALQLWNELDM